ncbi:MAG: hypothetical protein ACREBW_07180 [Candidatus Micrarchaeaceae archaeon]
MLISAGRIVRDSSEVNVLSTSSREICWRGFVYQCGLQAGAESLRELAEAREDQIPQIAAQLKGTYFIAVHCKDSRHIYAFVDQAGLYHAFYSRRLVGTSFLELSRLENCVAKDVDQEALVEFFHFGCIYGNRTLFPTIQKIDPDSVLRADLAGSIEILAKPISDIGEPPQRSFESLLQEFAIAAKKERVSVDITGGSDTRLIASALAYFDLPFETATSGCPGAADVEIAAKIATMLNRSFYPTFHSASRCDWEELFFRSDAMFDVTKNSRFIQLQHDRKSRGITLSISGAGGELFKDFWWLQDFPFYSRRVPRLARLYSFRIAPHPPQHSLLGPRYKAISEAYREKLLNRLSKYTAASNTKTYDRIYYYFKLRSFAGRFMTSSADLLPVAMPYLDPEAIRIGYSLPRSERHLNRFHRKLTTRYSGPVSRMPTTEGGMTSASGPWAISADLGRYVADRCKRLAKKAGQQLLGKTFLQESPDDPSIFEGLLRVVEARKSTQILADHGVLNNGLNAKLLPKPYLGTVFVLSRFFERLQESPGGQETLEVATSARIARFDSQLLPSIPSTGITTP